VALSAPIWVAEKAAIWVSANSLTSGGWTNPAQLSDGKAPEPVVVLSALIWVALSEEKAGGVERSDLGPR